MESCPTCLKEMPSLLGNLEQSRHTEHVALLSTFPYIRATSQAYRPEKDVYKHRKFRASLDGYVKWELHRRSFQVPFHDQVRLVPVGTPFAGYRIRVRDLLHIDLGAAPTLIMDFILKYWSSNELCTFCNVPRSKQRLLSSFIITVLRSCYTVHSEFQISFLILCMRLYLSNHV